MPNKSRYRLQDKASHFDSSTQAEYWQHLCSTLDGKSCDCHCIYALENGREDSRRSRKTLAILESMGFDYLLISWVFVSIVFLDKFCS